MIGFQIPAISQRRQAGSDDVADSTEPSFLQCPVIASPYSAGYAGVSEVSCVERV